MIFSSQFYPNKSHINRFSKLISSLPFINKVINSPVKIVSDYLKKDQWVGIIYLDIVNFTSIEQTLGHGYCRSILNKMKNTCDIISKTDKLPFKHICNYCWGDDVCIFFTGDSEPSLNEIYKTAFDLRAELVNFMNQYLANNINFDSLKLMYKMDFHVGYSIIRNSGNGYDKDFYNGLKECFMIAKNNYSIYNIEMVDALKKLITHKNFNIVYQPLVNLFSGEIIGYEALTRGPKGTSLESPGVIFPLAEKSGLLYPVEKITREKALEQICNIQKGIKLFLNINPAILSDSSFSAGNTKRLLEDKGSLPQNVVFEITERTSISDFPAFRKALEHYRRQGFQVAVDDVGAGYSSLQSVAELQPDYIKIDRSLISNIHKDRTKRALVETFVTFSRKINSILVAEGIECADELRVMMDLGVNIAQGYYIARPGYPFPEIKNDCLLTIKNKLYNIKKTYDIYPHIGDIAQQTSSVDIETPTGQVVELFNNSKDFNVLTVLDSGKPVGLVMRDKLFAKLSNQYGFALYCKRPIKLLMNNQPLIVEWDTTIDIVSQLSMQRNDDNLYDAVIICQNGNYIGTISIQQLLDVITNLKLEFARVSNPLTNLPGIPIIEAKISNRISNADEYAVIYIDLDDFKSFNDRYGFERGNIALKITSNILSNAVVQYGTKNDLLGHIGGDDFVIITCPSKVKVLCEYVIKSFSKKIPRLYDKQDRVNGYIHTIDRSGLEIQVPIMTISMAVIEGRLGNPASLEELSRLAADLKKKAKRITGSVFITYNSP